MYKIDYDFITYVYHYLLDIINELPERIEIDLTDDDDLNNNILYANYMFEYDNQTALQIIADNYELALDSQSIILLDEPDYDALIDPIPTLEVMVSTTINELLPPEYTYENLRKNNPNCKTIKLTPDIKNYLINQLHQKYHNMTGRRPIHG